MDGAFGARRPSSPNSSLLGYTMAWSRGASPRAGEGQIFGSYFDDDGAGVACVGLLGQGGKFDGLTVENNCTTLV
jgi:hypothetical protein